MFSRLGIDFLGMLFDVLLLRYEKNYLRGVWWIPILQIILFLIFKLTRNLLARPILSISLN